MVFALKEPAGGLEHIRPEQGIGYALKAAKDLGCSGFTMVGGFSSGTGVAAYFGGKTTTLLNYLKIAS